MKKKISCCEWLIHLIYKKPPQIETSKKSEMAETNKKFSNSPKAILEYTPTPLKQVDKCKNITIKTILNENQIKFSITEDQSEGLLFCCLKCFKYFDKILTLICCNGLICLFCAKEFQTKLYQTQGNLSLPCNCNIDEIVIEDFKVINLENNRLINQSQSISIDQNEKSSFTSKINNYTLNQQNKNSESKINDSHLNKLDGCKNKDTPILHVSKIHIEQDGSDKNPVISPADSPVARTNQIQIFPYFQRSAEAVNIEKNQSEEILQDILKSKTNIKNFNSMNSVSLLDRTKVSYRYSTYKEINENILINGINNKNDFVNQVNK